MTYEELVLPKFVPPWYYIDMECGIRHDMIRVSDILHK